MKIINLFILLFSFQLISDEDFTSLAISKNTGKLVEYIKNGNDINYQSFNGNTLLILSVMYNNTNAVKVLCDNGAKVMIPNTNGNTPLNYARSVEIAQILINHGANVNYSGFLGKKPIEEAIDSKNNELAQYYILQKATFESFEILFKTLQSSDYKIITTFINSGSDYNKTNSAKVSLIHIACSMLKNMDSFNLLVQNGGAINTITDFGDSTLHFAVRNQNGISHDLIRYLVGRGIEINKVNNDGNTPLHTAVQYSNIESIKTLLELGANKSIKNKQGKTPIDIVKEKKKNEIMELFSGK